MLEKGYIVEIVDEKTAKVRIKQHSACEHCGKCKTLSTESGYIVVEADNSYGAMMGDLVEVNMESVNVLKATAIVYLFPLMALLIGTIGSNYLLKSFGFGANINVEVVSAIVGLVLTGFTYLLIKRRDKNFRDSGNFIPIITRILIDL
ncbi:MAG: SoxR reducing system RseC family protein [Clostridioides sp.]|nr:SoxR reducing system RseC family protein [Clostridioides sp.]